MAIDLKSAPDATALRRTVVVVALLNLAYFGVEFAVALNIGSVALFADSVDFLEDASVNLLILMALAWSMRARARTGMALALILLAPGIATLWTAWAKIGAPLAPDPVALSLTGAGALAVNLFCALLLARFRHQGGSLTRAAFLSARNDAFANVAIIAAAIVTASVWRSAWPDLIVGLGIALLNIDAARSLGRGAARASRRRLSVGGQRRCPPRRARALERQEAVARQPVSRSGGTTKSAASKLAMIAS